MTDKFFPASFLGPDGAKSDKATGLIILNQPIHDQEIFMKAWKYTDYHICADGGANRLYDAFGDDEKTRKQFIPHVITGDFDSIKPEIKSYYEALGAKTIKNASEYSTDFMKSAHALKDLGDVRVVYAIGANGGRVDQEFHALHHLYLSREDGQTLYLIGAQSVSFLVPANKKAIIYTPLKYLGVTCGIIPLEGSTRVTTEGLRWDVSHWETSFATQLSTSNHLINDELMLVADKSVLFTAEIRGTEK